MTRSARRKSIAVLIDQLDRQIGGYEELLRAALNDECGRLGINQYLFVGRALNPSDPKVAAHNSIYELIASECVDGVILVSGGLSNHLGAKVVQQLC